MGAICPPNVASGRGGSRSEPQAVPHAHRWLLTAAMLSPRDGCAARAGAVPTKEKRQTANCWELPLRVDHSRAPE